MKALAFRSLFLLIYCVLIETKTSLVESAIHSILEANADKFSKINIICYQNDSRTNQVQELLRKSLGKYSSQVRIVAPSRPVALDSSSVLLFKSAAKFIENAKFIKWLSDPVFRYKHIVYAPNLTITDVTDNIEDGFDIDQVVFLMNETKKSIDIVSSFMFTKKKCRVNQLRVVNRFNGTSAAWKSQEFYPKKYRNFHNCKLTMQFEVNDATFKYSRRFFSMIGESLKFRISAVQVNNVEDFINETDLADCLTPAHEAYLRPMSFIFAEVKFIWVVPDGEPVPQVEKMFMMFDPEVWIAIGCFLLFWLVSIQIISRSSQIVRNFVFGRLVKTPTMNLFSIFLTGGQPKGPGRNFARFLLVLFLYWRLIFRTCYQSMLYQYLQMDLRRPRITTVADIVARNATIFNKNRSTRSNLVTVKCKSYTDCFNIIAEPANKGVTQVPELAFEGELEINLYSGVPSLHVLEEELSKNMFGFGFKRFSPLFEIFNRKLGQLYDSGLHRGTGLFTYPDKMNKFDDIGAQVLTMHHLGVAFIACLIPLGLAILVFFMEVVAQATFLKNK